MRWAVGVTTVPSRRDVLLPRTLAPLKAAGFEDVRLFIDGYDHDVVDTTHLAWDHPVTARGEVVRTWGNWWLGMHELWIRHPAADRYLMCQDDLVAVRNLRQYLDRMPKLLGQRYLNLHTFHTNEQVIAGQRQGTWHEAGLIGGNNSQRRQTGRSALALVFDHAGMQALLSSPLLVNKPLDSNRPTTRIDGSICHAMNLAGFREMVHCPSLVRHTGEISVIKSDQQGEPTHCGYPLDMTFPGELFDAMEFMVEGGADCWAT